MIGRDMSREAESYSLAVRLVSACFKITLTCYFKTLVRSLEYATTSLICKLRDCFSLKRQITNIHLGQHGIFHGYTPNSKSLERAWSRGIVYLFIYLFSDFVQSTRYIKQKDTSPLRGFSTWHPPTVK